MVPADIQPHLGGVVRRRRIALGFSQEDFAALVDLHRTYIGGFERGERNLTLANLAAVAAGLRVPLSTLVFEAEIASGLVVSDITLAMTALLDSLPSERRSLLVEMAVSMDRQVSSVLLPNSDICTARFAADFQNRLVVYHAMNDEVLKKKTFEYAFVRSMRMSGRNAQLVSSPVNAGSDVVVDGVAYSLKTEASQGIHQDRMTISKLMEARWIRECRTGQDFANGVTARVCAHLRQYNRIIVLRAFAQEAPCGFRYQMVEIPKDLLLQAGALSPEDFGPRTSNGSTSADILLNDNTRLFSLRLDGSVEKVTINNLSLAHCITHATWSIPLPPEACILR
jgi:transcriptional regulator with XRE-family HTH domain